MSTLLEIIRDDGPLSPYPYRIEWYGPPDEAPDVDPYHATLREAIEALAAALRTE